MSLCSDALAQYGRFRIRASMVLLAALVVCGWLVLHDLLAHMPLFAEVVVCGVLVCAAGLAIVAALCMAHIAAVRAAIAALASTIEGLPSEGTARFLPAQGPASVVRLIQSINGARRGCLEREAELLAVQASYAHDLRTPMTRMILRCELVEDETLRNAMERDLDEMRELAEASLACARMQGSAAQPFRHVDADGMLETLVANYRDAGRTVGLEGHIGHSLVTCPHALRRILVNLIDNALRYGSDVRLLVRNEAGRLNLAIVDSGPGIAPAQLESVFLPWYRSPETAGHAPGSGLGLAIARRLALAIRGDLKLENRVEGGLEARLTLPL